MKFRKIIILFSFTIGFLPMVSGASAVFISDLKLGVNSNEVLQLQKILNSDKDTQISETGAGSPGNETNYFGNLTKNALIRFQNKYKNEVLIPAGLYEGTGFVGVLTRSKLNLMSSGANQTINLPNGIDNKGLFPTSTSFINNDDIKKTESFLSKYNKTLIFSIEPKQVTPGGKVIIYGIGIATSGNSVYFGNSQVVKAPLNSNGTEINLTIPVDFPVGSYDVWVDGPRGSSNNTEIKPRITITNDLSVAPKINSISPNKFIYGKDVVVTIAGSNFSANGNNIYSFLGDILNVGSVDGKTLSFDINSLANLPRIIESSKSFQSEFEVPVWLSLVNDYGMSEPSVFYIVFNKK